MIYMVLGTFSGFLSCALLIIQLQKRCMELERNIDEIKKRLEDK